MALLLHSSASTVLFHRATAPPHRHHPSKAAHLSVRCQDPSSEDSIPSSSTAAPPSISTKTSSTGLGFGAPSATKKKQKGQGEAASVIRRAPVQKPSFASEKEEARAKEQRKNESAFLLAWLGLGAIILVQGIGLAASGFLPEEWDNLFVKYLYPSFTPTVFLFVAGTVSYGVLKYLQNESVNNES